MKTAAAVAVHGFMQDTHFLDAQKSQFGEGLVGVPGMATVTAPTFQLQRLAKRAAAWRRPNPSTSPHTGFAGLSWQLMRGIAKSLHTYDSRGLQEALGANGSRLRMALILDSMFAALRSPRTHSQRRHSYTENQKIWSQIFPSIFCLDSNASTSFPRLPCLAAMSCESRSWHLDCDQCIWKVKRLPRLPKL